MKIIATISDMSRVAAIVDAYDGGIRFIPGRKRFLDDTIAERAPIRPFGITWTTDELFIANHRQLLVFDRNFQYKRTDPISLQINTHQLARHDERIWAVNTRGNSLIGLKPSETQALELDLIAHRVHQYNPKATALPRATHHFNSLLWSGDRLYVAAHNHRNPSFINEYDATTLNLLSVRKNAGFAIHGIALHGDEFLWLSTDTWEIRSSHGYALRLPHEGYARGFAVTDRYLIVAISERMDRALRVVGNSSIEIFDRENRKRVARIPLQDTGSVNDLRLLDEHDYAHQLDPFITRQ